jgi:hypothetical protein
VRITVEDYKSILHTGVSWRRPAHVRIYDDSYAR